MDKEEEHIIDVLASKVNNAAGIIEAKDGIVDFEEILNSRQKMVDEVVEKASRTGDVPKNLVAEIEKERGNRNADKSRLEGKVAEVEKGLKKLMEAGKRPSHAVIEDDKFEIFGKSNDGDELDR